MTEPRPVPMVDLRAQYLRIQPDVDAALQRVIDTTAFIKGEDCSSGTSRPGAASSTASAWRTAPTR
jgi:hypothetical protein